MKKFKSSILFIALLLFTVSGNAAGVTVCYQGACRPMTQYEPEQIMMQLEEIFSNNQREILFCESDIQTRKCRDRSILFSGHYNSIRVDFQVPLARMNHVKAKNGVLEMVLDYQIKANQYHPQCLASNSSLALITSWNGEIRLVSPSFNCRTTDFGMTRMSFQFDVDYINLDTGYFGAVYQATAQGDVLGQKSGYTLFQVVDNRYAGEERPLPKKPVLGKARTTKATPDWKNKSIFDWNSEDWSAWWKVFKEKALKVIYLEPLE